MAGKLIDVATLQPNHREISQDAGTAAGGQIVPQGLTEGIFSQVRTSKLDVAGAAFFSEPGTIEPEPSAIARIIRQFPNLPGTRRGWVHQFANDQGGWGDRIEPTRGELLCAAPR